MRSVDAPASASGTPRTPTDAATGLPLAVCVVVGWGTRTLMIRRSRHTTMPGYWTPVTGRVEADESLVEAARREVQEEVGLDVVVAPDELQRCPTSNGAFLMVWFAARPKDHPTVASGSDMPPALRLAPREVDAARWLTREEILGLEPTFPATRAWFSR